MRPKRLSKITPPELPKVVLRKRLFRLLDQKRHYKVTWISAMVGSGKTTLVASYLSNRNFPCLWYEMDESDDDLATFFYYLGLAATESFPRRQKPPPSLTHDYLGGASVFARRFFEYLSSNVSLPFFIVFDNYHKIPEGSPFHEVLKSGISGVFSGIHIIVLSRSNPPQTFSSMLANNEMRIINTGDLLLSLQESQELLEIESKKKLPAEAVKLIYKETRGWAAGLVLMANSSGAHNVHVVLSDELIPETIFEYFATEFFDKMDSVLKKFLLKTAFLPYMNASLARAMTGRKDTNRILSFLKRNHFFVTTYFAASTIYQYHPLLRKFLKTKAEDTFSAKELKSLKRKAASLLQKEEQFEDAVNLLCEAEDLEGLVKLILRQAHKLIEQGRHKTLSQWVRRVPKGIIDKEPWLLYWLGVSELHLSCAQAKEHLKHAFRLFELNNDMAGLYLSWSSIVEGINSEWNDFKKLDPWLDWFDRKPFPQHAFPSQEIELRVAMSLAKALIIRRPGHPDIKSWIEKAFSLSRELGNVVLYFQAMSSAMMYYPWVGDFAKVEVIAKETQELAKSLSASPPLMLQWKWLDLSTRICSMKEIDSALDEISEAITTARKNGLNALEPVFLMPAIFISFLNGDLSSVERYLSRLQSILDLTHEHVFSIYHHFRSLYNLHLGDLTQAKAHAERALKIAQDTGYILASLVCRFQLAYTLAELGETQESKAQLSLVYGLALKIKSRIFEFMCLLLKAKIALDQKNDSEGIQLLNKALSLGRKHNYMTMAWWWYPPAISRLCSKALEEGIEVNYVSRFIRVTRLTPNTNENYDMERWPWPLKIHTFGHFQILKHDEPIRFSKKVQKMPLNMLKGLVSYGGIEVHMDKIIDALWPDTDGDMAYNAFTTTLTRLRKLIGIRDVLQLHDGKLSLNPKYCCLDTWVFERTLAEADILWKQNSRREALLFYNRVIDQYQDNFLAKEPQKSWMISLQERLKRKFLSAIKKVGKNLEEENKFDEAIAYYEKGLRIDQLEEFFYQRLMYCYQLLGRKAQALKTYRRCEEKLYRVLKASPSLETKRIYQEILEEM